MQHLHSIGVLIGRAKTRKTLCEKRVPESAMAQNGQSAVAALEADPYKNGEVLR